MEQLSLLLAKGVNERRVNKGSNIRKERRNREKTGNEKSDEQIDW